MSAATDATGNLGTDELSFTLYAPSSSGPQITLTQPAAGAGATVSQRSNVGVIKGTVRLCPYARFTACISPA